MKKLGPLLLAVFLLLPIRAARAVPGCTVSLTSISFGNYDVFNSGGVSWSGTVSYVCSGGANGPIFIDVSAGSSASYAQRKMALGSNQLNYNVYTDSLHSTIWGDGVTGGTGEYLNAANPSNGVTVLVPIYGQIPALQDANVGAYADTLTVTIFWTKKAIDHSGTATTAVGGTVISKCSINTSAVPFGAYDPVVTNAVAPKAGQGAVNTSCTKGTATTIGLDLGLNFTGTQRRLKTGANFLNYQLYQDSNQSIVWGSSGASLLTPLASPTDAQQTFVVYGLIPGGQDAATGSYSDTVTATVTY